MVQRPRGNGGKMDGPTSKRPECKECMPIRREGKMQGEVPHYPVHNPPGEDVTHGQDTEDEDLGMAALFQETE